MTDAGAGQGRILVVTGHFPPAPGGVQTFTWEMLRRMPAQRLAVIAPQHRGAAAFDSQLDFPVIRRRGYFLVQDLRRLVADLGCTSCWIPAVAPIGLAAPFVRRAGVARIVGSTHGQELGWLRVPPTRAALRRMIASMDAVTCLGDYTRRHLSRVADPHRLHRLVGGVDTSVFHPGAGGAEVKRRLGLDGPTVISVARLVRRKGHDTVIAAWPRVLRALPGAKLIIPGSGVHRPALEKQVAAAGLQASVRFTGFLPVGELARYLAASDVFVLACRDDRAGLQTEGLGLSTLEASASGLPVVVGESGGSGDSLIEGVTGLLVDSHRPGAVADALITLLMDPSRARAMGEAGARWVRDNWAWEGSVARLTRLLDGEPVDVDGSGDIGRPVAGAARQVHQ